MSSAAEEEHEALFFNTKTAVPMHRTFKELGQTQPQTTIQTNKKTSDSLINNKIVAKATKSINIKFQWL